MNRLEDALRPSRVTDLGVPAINGKSAVKVFVAQCCANMKAAQLWLRIREQGFFDQIRKALLMLAGNEPNTICEHRVVRLKLLTLLEVSSCGGEGHSLRCVRSVRPVVERPKLIHAETCRFEVLQVLDQLLSTVHSRHPPYDVRTRDE